MKLYFNVCPKSPSRFTLCEFDVRFSYCCGLDTLYGQWEEIQGVFTWSVTVDSGAARWGSGPHSLLPPAVHTPAVSSRTVALQRPVLTLFITLGDEGSSQGVTV